jgi:uracil phosphoribosyltransferase
MLFVLDQTPSIANEFLRQLRDKNIQSDRLRFKKNLERIGEIMAYEVSKKLSYTATTIDTPLAATSVQILRQQPVLITILRAGLPFFQGFANFFDNADCGFVGAYREEGATTKLRIHLDYVASGNLNDRVVILIDPMLATGKSVIHSLEVLLKKGTPSHLHIVSLVAAPEGIDYLKSNISIPYSLWTCSVDKTLDSNFYIVPGLGDAGDLSFGVKI